MFHERRLTRLTRAKLGLELGSHPAPSTQSHPLTPPPPAASQESAQSATATSDMRNKQQKQQQTRQQPKRQSKQPQQQQQEQAKQQPKQAKQQPKQPKQQEQVTVQPQQQEQATEQPEATKQPEAAKQTETKETKHRKKYQRHQRKTSPPRPLRPLLPLLRPESTPPSPRTTTNPSISLVPAPAPARSDYTANTANINIPAPRTPDSSSSSELCRSESHDRSRATTGTLEVDTQSRHFSLSPYRTPTWSPETSLPNSQQPDSASQQERIEPKTAQEENNNNNNDPAEDALFSPLSLLSAVASVVGNRIGGPGLSNLDDLATCESLRSLSSSAPAPALSPSPNSSSTVLPQDSALAYPSRKRERQHSNSPTIPQTPVSVSPTTATLTLRPLAPAQAQAPAAHIRTSSSATEDLDNRISRTEFTPRKRGRPPKYSGPLPVTQDKETQTPPRPRSYTPCSSSSTTSLLNPSSSFSSDKNRPIVAKIDPFTTTTTVMGEVRKSQAEVIVPFNPLAYPILGPRLKHNRKPGPDGAVWSAAELAAETSAVRRLARAVVYADDLLRLLVEQHKVPIQEPCFRTPLRGDLYCLGSPREGVSGTRHDHGVSCIHERRNCRIILAFRYRYQVRLDVTYLAWVNKIDLATIPVSVLRDFTVNKELMKLALEGEKRMSNQYKLLLDAGYFEPRKEDRRSQQQTPDPNVVATTVVGWSIAHQNEALMATKSNRMAFLQWVAQAYLMARGESPRRESSKRIKVSAEQTS